ncbi:MAG: hypothetical protein ACFFC7_24845 [Candidatus Hermodarchaeota archaeon]
MKKLFPRGKNTEKKVGKRIVLGGTAEVADHLSPGAFSRFLLKFYIVGLLFAMLNFLPWIEPVYRSSTAVDLSLISV